MHFSLLTVNSFAFPAILLVYVTAEAFILGDFGLCCFTLVIIRFEIKFLASFLCLDGRSRIFNIALQFRDYY